MIKVTIECEGVKSVVEVVEAITLDEALQLCEQALLGVGFQLDGTLQITTDGDANENLD